MRKSLQAILRHTPHEKQVMMFSATMGPDTSGTCKKFMHQVLYLPTSSSLSLFSLLCPFLFPVGLLFPDAACLLEAIFTGWMEVEEITGQTPYSPMMRDTVVGEEKKEVVHEQQIFGGGEGCKISTSSQN